MTEASGPEPDSGPAAGSRQSIGRWAAVVALLLGIVLGSAALILSLGDGRLPAPKAASGPTVRAPSTEVGLDPLLRPGGGWTNVPGEPPGSASALTADPAGDPAGQTPALPTQKSADGRGMRVVIPGIGVDAPVIDLGLNPDGTLEVPTRFDQAGWYTGGSLPGEAGPAVIVGHVSSRQGPGVFYRLRDLRPGDLVRVIRPDGSVARFRVEEVVQYPKSAFPTERVYGDVTGSRLRLITCGGAFDYSTGHFVDNVVVFAREA